MPKKAIIAGATGLIGKQLLTQLTHSDIYDQITVLSRREVKSENAKVKIEIVDFDKLDVLSDYWKADDVFCCLGTTMKKAGSKDAFRKVDFEYPMEIARCAKKNGATSYHLISALGADSKSGVFYNQVKGEAEQAIKKVGFTCYHIYRPSLLFGNREEFRLGEKIGIHIFKFFNFLMIGPLKKYKGIQSFKVAHSMFTEAKKCEPGYFIHESVDMQKQYV